MMVAGCNRRVAILPIPVPLAVNRLFIEYLPMKSITSATNADKLREAAKNLRKSPLISADDYCRFVSQITVKEINSFRRRIRKFPKLRGPEFLSSKLHKYYLRSPSVDSFKPVKWTQRDATSAEAGGR